MGFINQRLPHRCGSLALMLLLLIFGGCALPPKDNAEKDKAEQVDDDTVAAEQTEEGKETEGEAAEVAFVPLPNPYLANPPEVPKQAKKEFTAALAAMNAGDWKQAAGMLTLMTETYPTLSGPLVNLGLCQYRLEQWQYAEKTLLQAIAVNNTNMDAYTALGVLYREQGKFADAEKNYLAALTVWPHHPDSHRNLGILYDMYMGRFPEALEHYQMLQKLLPEEDRELKGWILDLERRMAERGEQQ